MARDPLTVLRDPARLAVLRSTGLLHTTPDPALDRFTHLAARLVGAPMALLVLVDADRSLVRSATGLPDPPSPDVLPALARACCLDAVAQAEPVVVISPASPGGDPFARRAPVPAEPGAEPGAARATGSAGAFGAPGASGSCACYPLVVRDQAIGALCVLEEGPRAWTDEQLTDLEELAAALSSELALRLVLRDLQRRGQDARRYAEREIGLLERITRDVAAAAELADGFPPALEKMARFGRWDFAEVWLRDAGGAFERIAAWYADERLEACARAGAELRFHLGQGLLGRVVEGRAAVQVEDPAELAELPVGASPPCPPGSAVVVPLAADEVLGVFCFGSREARATDPHGLAVLSAMAAQLAPVVQRRQAELLALETQTRLTGFINTINELVMSIAPDGRVAFLNEAWKRTLGFTEEDDLSNLRLERILHPDSVETFLGVLGRVLRGEYVPDVQASFVSRDGRVTMVEGFGNARYVDGKPISMRTIFQDVTARRHAEQQLRDSQRRLQAIVEGALDAIITVDERGVIQTLNPAAGRMFGYEAGELAGRSVDVLLPGSGSAEPHDAIASLGTSADGELVGTREVVGRRRDGTAFPLELSVSETTLGERRFLTAIMRDITARRAAEDELRRHAQMLDLANESIVIHTLEDSTITYWNRGAERLYGWTREEAVGHRMSELLQPAFPAPFETVREAVVEDGRWEGEVLHTRRDGGEVTVESHWTLLHENGGPPSVLEINADATERKRTQAIFGAVLRAATENSIIAFDPDGLITTFNAGAERMLGYPADEVVGVVCVAALHDPQELADRAAQLDLEPGFAALIEVARGGAAETREWTYVRKDGSRLPVSLTVTVMRDDYERVTGFIGIAYDVTERRRIEQALRGAKDAAEKAARAKSEFLANMSHEIRTPMNGIIGMTELLLDMELSAEQREYMEMVRGSAESLLRIINDILDFSRIEAGKMALDAHPFHLRDAFGDTLKTLAVRARERRIELAHRVAPDVPDALVGDVGRLRQVLVNLVSNAIKFTEQGEVVVDVSGQPDARGGVQLEVVVRDTGIGIPPERRAVIFEAFTQADPSTTRRFGGTGLGLSISSQLVALMGGRLSVESEAGAGSTFRFAVRLATDPAAQGEPDGAEDAALLAGRRTLVVDDNATSRAILQEMLGGWQVPVVACDGPAAALEQLRLAAASPEPFELALVDAAMPDGDGFELARQILQDPGLTAGVVLMLASTADPRDVQRCRESGIDVYLAKPIKQKDLLAAARHALGAPLPASSVPAPDTPRVPGRAPARGLRVLVAEDNPVNQRLALAILEHEGYAAVLAANGVEALRLFDAEPFDLILMDVQMPELGGFETTALIREREQRTGHHTPIVAVTAHAMDGDRERCLAAGMDAYISKPLRAGELTELLASMAPLFPPVARVGADPGDPGAVADTGERGDRGDLGTAVEPGDAGTVADAGDLAAAGDAGAPVVAGAAGAPGAPAEPTALPQPGGREDPVAPGALPAGLLAAVGGDGALALELAGLFLVDSPQALDELGQALFAGDAERVGRAAHRLKGAAAALAADEVTHAAAEVEALARTGDLNGAAAALAALQEAHGALCAVLSAARGPGA